MESGKQTHYQTNLHKSLNMFQILNWLSVKDRIEYHNYYILVYKAINGHTSEYLNLLFQSQILKPTI